MSANTIAFYRTAFLLLLAATVARPARAQPAPGLFAEAGIAGGGSVSRTPAGSAASAVDWLGGVTVTSAPLRMGRGWDFSVDARLAREPTAGMARVGGGIAPTYFQALRGSGSLWFVHTSGPFDVAIVGRYAETRIDAAQALRPAANDNGLWTFMFEATAHLRLYAAADAARPASVRRLMPLVDLYGGVKHDRRYHRNGDLEPFDDPTGRALGGIFIAAWRWRDRGGVPAIVLGGGGDFEAALRTGVRLPSAGRVFARASFDLRRLAPR